MREEFMIETTYNSNAIEGNTITLRETALILNEGITIAEKPLKDHLDIIGYKDAFWFMIDVARQKSALTEFVIKQIHALVLMADMENKGVYRSIPVRIQGSSHTPPEPYLVAPQMEQLLLDYSEWKNDFHPIVAIAKLHLAFEAIHPFIDGNGRTGRLLLNLELIKQGLLPVDIKYVDRAKYYACFDAYHQENENPNMLADLIAEYERQELIRYLSIVETATAMRDK